MISVIVPIYRVEEYLKRCVDSILNQTYNDLEIILVDDGSPDNCPAICDEYAKKDSRIKVIHKENGGLSDARNAGLAIAKGEWLSFIDSDDWIEPDMYEILLKNATEYNSQISVGGVNDELCNSDSIKIIKTTFDGKEDIKCLSPKDAMRKHLLGSWAAWDKIYRREVFKDIKFPVGEINEDEVIMLKLLDKCERIVYNNRVFYHYIHRAESITTASFSPKKLVWVKHCKDNLEWIRKNYPELESEALSRLLSSILWSMREMALSKESFSKEMKKIRKELKSNFKVFKNIKTTTQQRLRLYMINYFPVSLYKMIECSIYLSRGKK